MPDDFGDMMFAGLSQTWTGPMDFGVDFEDFNVQDWWQYGEVPSNYMIKQGYGTLVTRMGEGLPVKLNTRPPVWTGAAMVYRWKHPRAPFGQKPVSSPSHRVS